MGFVKKRFWVIAKELNRFRKVLEDDAVDYSHNVARLKSKVEGFSKEIQEWKVASSAQAPLQGSHEQPRIEEIVNKQEMEKMLKQEIVAGDTKRLGIISIFREIGIENVPQVEKIYKSREVNAMFPCRAWLVVDTNWSLRHLILDILQQVISSFKTKTKLKDENLIQTLDRLLEGKEKLKEEELIGRLGGFLKDKKYLIVINDIKSLELLEKLRGTLPDPDNESRVVITTPDERAASFADASSCVHYRPLDKESGFKKLKEEVDGPVKESPLSVEIEGCLKEKIADICRGNPLRIKLLAGFLSTNEEILEDWSSVDKKLDFVNKSPSFDILSFAYSDLPPHLKPCFLYVGLFHKGFEIPVRRLLRLWLAEGFVEPIQGITPEDKVEAYLEDLVQRNMVEITKKRSNESSKNCRMIGSLHDIFRPRAVEIGLFHLHQKSKKESNEAAEHQLEVRRVVECTNIKDFSTSKAFNQNLQSYISLNKRKKDTGADDVGTFLTRMIGARGFGLLKVLDLEEVDRPRLPKNLGNLFHFLRYLGLRYTFVKTLPSSLGALHRLQTLDIKHTQITTIPSSIWILMCLRHLCLNRARIEIPLQHIQHTAPHQLHTLQGLFLDEKTAGKMSSTLEMMTNLRKLDLTIELSASHVSSYEEIDLWISSLSSLRSLRLRSINTKGQPSQLNMINDLSRLQNLSELYLLGHLPQSLDWYKIPCGVKALTLSVSQLKEDPMPILSKLSNLTVLRLLATSYVGEEMRFPEKGFPALQVLKLWKLENLKKITVEEGTMQKLQTLEIRCCEQLIDKEVPDTLLKIKELCNLILTNMPKEFVNAMKRRKKKHYKIEVDPDYNDDSDISRASRRRRPSPPTVTSFSTSLHNKGEFDWTSRSASEI